MDVPDYTGRTSGVRADCRCLYCQRARGVMEDHRNVIVIHAPEPSPDLKMDLPKTRREYTERAPRRGKFKPRKRGR